MPTPYEELGVPETATDAVIASRYRALAKGLHPDVTCGDKQKAERLKHLTAAYNRLKTRDGREQVDREIREQRARKAAEAFAAWAATMERRKKEAAAAERARREREASERFRRPVQTYALTRRPAAATKSTPMPFGDLASSISQLRPRSEAAWWALGGAIADIIWTSSRR